MSSRRGRRTRRAVRSCPPLVKAIVKDTAVARPDPEVLSDITAADMTAALDAIDAWHHDRHNAAVRIVQDAARRGVLPGFLTALVWATTEVLNEYAGDQAADWQARLRAQVTAVRGEASAR